MAKNPKNTDTATDSANGDGQTQDVARNRITIGGQEFDVASPYTEGHVLTGPEARAMNQLLHENLRNNFAKKVKDGMATGKSRDDLQAELDQYASSYTFEAKRVGGVGRTADPVRREAKAIARNSVIANLKKQGKNVKDVDPTKLADYIDKLSQRDDIMELAKKRVAEQQALAGDALGELEAA